MKKPLKDNIFTIVYLYDELQFCTNEIPNMIVGRTGKSQVISARGGEQTEGYYLLDNGKFIRETNASERKWSDIYLQAKHAEEDKNNTDKSYIEAAKQIVALGDSKFVKELIILAYADEIEFKSDDPSVIMVKNGGTEIIAEYILSNFVGNYVRLKNEDRGKNDIDYRIKANRISDSVTQWAFDFGINDTLSELEKIDYSNIEIEMDGSAWGKSHQRYQFKLNANAISELNKKLEIPSRIRKIMTEEQLGILKDQGIEIILENIDFIEKEFFR